MTRRFNSGLIRKLWVNNAELNLLTLLRKTSMGSCALGSRYMQNKEVTSIRTLQLQEGSEVSCYQSTKIVFSSGAHGGGCEQSSQVKAVAKNKYSKRKRVDSKRERETARPTISEKETAASAQHNPMKVE